MLQKSASLDDIYDTDSPKDFEHPLPALTKKLWEEIGRARMENPPGAGLSITRELAQSICGCGVSVTPELADLVEEEMVLALMDPDAKDPGHVTISAELATRIWEELGPRLKNMAGDLADLTMTPELAEKISEEIGPRVTFLTNRQFKPNFLFPGSAKKVTILATGCGGDIGDAQEAVAEAMDNYIAAHPEQNFVYVINTGDNFYSKGVDSPTHRDFHSKFYHPYFDPKYPHLRRLRFLMTLGNHDGNRRKLEYWIEPLRQYYMILYYTVNKIKKIDTSVPPSGKDAEKNQVTHMHFFHPEDTRLRVTTRRRYQEKRVDVSELRKFDMPYYHTSRVEKDKFQYFFVNSNSLLQDYFDYLAHISGVKELSPDALRTNQVAFLLKEYPKCIAAKRIPILVQHHPFMPMGDRAYPKNYDSPFYLYPDQVKRLDLILQLPHKPEEEYLAKVLQILIAKPEQLHSIPGVPLPTVDAENYCVMLARFFASYNMIFRMLVCAHDHMLAYKCVDGIKNVSQNYRPDDPKKRPVKPTAPRPDLLSSYPVRQLTTGGGGGKLQDCDVFSQIEDLGFCMKDNGFMAFTLDPDKPDVIEIHVMSIKHTKKMVDYDHRRPWEDNLYLRFDTRSAKAIREPLALDPQDTEAVLEHYKVDTLTSIVLNTCVAYNRFLNNKMDETSGKFFDITHNYTHKRSDVIIMHKMMNYLNQYQRTNYAETVEELHELALEIINKGSDHSFLKSINETLKKNKLLGNKDLNGLFAEVKSRPSCTPKQKIVGRPLK